MADRIRGPRQSKEWVHIGTNIINQISADGTFVGASAFTADRPLTVLRMIGEYQISQGAVNVIQDTAAVTVAIGVFSADAVTLGGTAMPDPEDETAYPWLFWASHFMTQQIAAQNSDGDPQMSIRRTFDIRSMRKMKTRESLTYVFQYRDVSGAPTINIVLGRARVLIGKGG